MAFGLWALPLQAAVYTVGTGTTNTTTSGITPFSLEYHDNRIQYLYQATELTAVGAPAGDILSLAINVTALGGPAPENVTIKVAQVTGYVTLADFKTAAFTTVYTGAELAPFIGWNIYPFSAPFTWDGTSNLLVEICRDNSTGGSNYGVQTTQLAPDYRSTYGYFANDVAGCSMTLGTVATAAQRRYRPNMQFDIVAATPCAGIPDAGTVPATAQVSCAGGVATIMATGLSDGDGMTYQWQEWDGGAWVDVTGGNGATGTNYNTAPVTGSKQYRLRSYCTNSGEENFTNTCEVELLMAPSCYCTVSASPNDNTGITSVQFNTLLNTSSGSGAYQNYTSFSTEVLPGNSYPLSVNVRTNATVVYTKAWIDWNRNGTFDASEEYDLGQANTGNNTTTDGSPIWIQVPPATSPGNVLMRIRAVYNTAPVACGDQPWSETEDYWVVVLENPACTGVPDGGTVPATMGNCPGNSVTVHATGAGTGGGITYQWQEWDGTVWVPATGGTGANSQAYTTPPISGSMQYRLRTFCANSNEESFTNTCTVGPDMTPACYCTVSASSNDGTGVRNVTFNTIDNTTTGNGAYNDYSAQSTEVYRGLTYPLSVNVNTVGSTVYAKAWIDWDQNGVFDAGEEYDLGSASTGSNTTTDGSPVNITVPATALLGNTIMRVRATYSTAPTACGEQPWSEAEDYTIQVMTNPPCTGTPDAGTVPATVEVCAGNPAVIMATGVNTGDGISFQWQEWNGVEWINVVGGSGATTATYTTPMVTGSKQYRLESTCANGGDPSYTNACTVGLDMSAACYCTVSASSNDGTGIRNVSFNTIDNTTTGSGAYNNYMAISTDVTKGLTYPLSVSVNTVGTFTIQAKAWVDWNQNGVFEATEAYDLGSAYDGNPIATSNSPLAITIPVTAQEGNTVMRIRAVYGNEPQPCGDQPWSEAEDYVLNVQPNPPCTGEPDAGTLPATLSACPGQPTTITATGVTTDDGTAYQWQEWDGSEWVDVVEGSGAQTASYTTGIITGTMEYRLMSTCTNSNEVNYSNTCAVSLAMGPACYCAVSAEEDDATGITNVTFNTINNSSVGGPVYTDFTAISTVLTQGNSYDLSVKVNTSGDFTVRAKAWIDWDQDGVFDAGEAYDLGSANEGSNTTTNGSPVSVMVPPTAALGTTMMRVRAVFFDDPQPCGDQWWSEAEDYTLVIEPCTGPMPTAEATNSGPYCEGDQIELNVATDVGTTFAWTGPGGFTSSGQNPVVPAASMAHAGTYTVVVGTSGGNCTAVSSTSVTVNPYPANVSAWASAASVCAGTTVDLIGEGGLVTISLFQNFDGDLTGWTTANNSTGGTPAEAAWALYNSGASIASPDNSIFVGSNSDAQGGGTTNTVLFSPEFSLANTTSPSLTFNHYFYWWDDGDEGNVYVSTDGGANFTLVESYTSTQGSELAFAAASIDLSAYAGEPSMMLAFQYVANWGVWWLIDDIQVSALAPANFSWSSSPAGFTSNEQNPTGVVVNTATTYTLTASTDAGCSVTDQVSVAVQAGNSVRVAITTDSNPEEITWEIVDAASNVLVSGGPYTGQSNTTIVEDVCMTDPQGEWYGFKVEDSGNDGITGGGWELRTTDGKLILRDNFDMPFASSPVVPGNSPTYGAYHSFALPLGAVNIQPDECGIMNNRADNKVYAVKQAGNNYLNSTLNYQFEFSNPDSGRFRRIAKPRNYVIFSEMASLKPLVAGVTYFARVRTDKEGVMTDARWGAGCEMALGSNVACTGLIDDPEHQYYSCNVTRRFRHSSFLVAKPVYGATQYEFRVYQPGEGYDHSFVRNTYTLELNWTAAEAPVLENLSSYQVQVRAKVNNVWGNYCDACPLYIDNTPTIPQGSLVQVSGEATLWPNPSRDGQVSLNIDGIAGDVQHITVDVKDIYGQHVYGQEFSNSGDRFNTVLDLPGDIATGVYMVNITVNGEVMTKRLSIVR